MNKIQRNFTGSKISTHSTKFVFFGPIRKTVWPPWPLNGWDIFDFSSKTIEQNSMKLDRKQDLNVLYNVCVFGLIGKTRWPLWPLIGWDIFDFSSETFDWNSTQDLNVLYQVCVFWANRKNKWPSWSDWLRHFQLLLWNRWTEFNETWQEARSQRPLLSLCFSGRSEKRDGHPGLWLAETFSTFALKPLNGIQQNFIGSTISSSSTKFVLFGPIGKTRRPPWPLIGRDIFDFSSETAERNSTKLDRKQDLNVLYQVCVFSGRSEKQDGRPGLWLAETFSTSPLKPLNGIQRNLTGSKISTSSTKFLFFGPIRKTRWPPWPMIGWDIFDFSSETAEWNSTKLHRKQDLNLLYQVCVFRADR